MMGCPNRQLLAKNCVFFQTKLDRREDHSKINFDYFQIQKWMLQTVWVERVDEKNGIICPVSIFLTWVMVLKLYKKVHFLQLCVDLSRKSKSTKVIYIYASERLCYALSVNGIVYYAMTYCVGGIRVSIQRTLLSQHLFLYFNWARWKTQKTRKTRKFFSEIFKSEFSILAIVQNRKLGNKKTRNNISEISEFSEFSICHFFLFFFSYFFFLFL